MGVRGPCPLPPSYIVGDRRVGEGRRFWREKVELEDRRETGGGGVAEQEGSISQRGGENVLADGRRGGGGGGGGEGEGGE